MDWSSGDTGINNSVCSVLRSSEKSVVDSPEPKEVSGRIGKSVAGGEAGQVMRPRFG